MSLTTALNIAQSSLRSLTRQTAVVSSNVANAQNPDYARRSASIESTNGGVRFVEARRHTSDGLFSSALRALSDGQAQSTLADRISTLRTDLLGADDGLSLVAYRGHQNLTVGGELNKLAANIALGRDAAGVHWRSDSIEGLFLGETVALGVLADLALTYVEEFPGFQLTRFDGTTVTIHRE